MQKNHLLWTEVLLKWIMKERIVLILMKVLSSFAPPDNGDNRRRRGNQLMFRWMSTCTIIIEVPFVEDLCYVFGSVIGARCFLSKRRQSFDHLRNNDG
ncbi:hypothetical protein D5086_010961 [Populus alba]|uniref:Uncharacterized protein n=1 Tax=Populus alba TaxID=43335 RepID=A0ACC4CC90_POPAL